MKPPSHTAGTIIITSKTAKFKMIFGLAEKVL